MANAEIQRARRLRKDMTPQEIALWLYLRSLRSEGWHFRRQSPERPYTLDFICKRAKLIVEIDGAQHASAEQAAHDKRRDALLDQRGFRVVRFWASEVEHDLDGVMQTIRNTLGTSPYQLKPAALPANKVGNRYRTLVRMGLKQKR